MVTKVKKPSAADRTVDLFAPKEQVLSTEDTTESVRLSETIEVAAERWRNNAFFTQEHFSKHFNDSIPGTAKYRITEKGGNMFLEQFRLGKDGEAYHWSGVMFASSDLNELTNVFVRAARSKAGG